jgi:hypothetical protein
VACLGGRLVVQGGQERTWFGGGKVLSRGAYRNQKQIATAHNLQYYRLQTTDY